jgi:hypothetical protein
MVDVDVLTNQSLLYEGRIVQVVVPKWGVEGDTRVYPHPRVKQVYHLIAGDLDRVKRLADDRRSQLWLTGQVQRRGAEVHLVGCRVDRIEETLSR